ncbi:MAG: DeoR/GlpR family DNA-binding transcription regulator [Atopobiaceae bacterium]|jgi:DeoR family glycerol-3-phosphate regulon repressor|nr:DeoR/GlpR family DNA-binding transcription regulator [Atopobiaceae bacterium]
MSLKERQEQIIRLIAENGRVSVSDLARRFSVSEDRVRKDLKQLDADGRCTRVYGGAIAANALPDRDVFKRVNDYRDSKQVIARKAYSQITDGQTIFLDISTTNLYLAERISKSSLNLIVVSNMMDVLKEVAKNPNVIAICPGGSVNLELNGFVGTTAVNMLSRMRFDSCFMGAIGIDLPSGDCTTFDVDDGLVKETVISNSTVPYLVMDSHKFGLRGNYCYASVAEFSALISDGANEKGLEQVRSMGVSIL